MAENDPRKDRTGFQRFELLLLLILLFVGEVIGIVAALLTYRLHHPGVAKLFAAAAITLLFGSLLGGVVTLLIADFDRRRVQRAAEMDFIGNVLADLKGVHDRVDRGRTLIKARQSAKTYGEEMVGFIEARVTLKNVERALRTDERGEPIAHVLEEVQCMDKYIHELLQEYEEHYKTISLTQSIFEAQLKKALDAPAPGSRVETLPRNAPWDWLATLLRSEPSDKVESLPRNAPLDGLETLPRNAPWDRLVTLERLKDFMLPLADAGDGAGQTASRYAREFLAPLDVASEQLRSALASARGLRN